MDSDYQRFLFLDEKLQRLTKIADRVRELQTLKRSSSPVDVKLINAEINDLERAGRTIRTDFNKNRAEHSQLKARYERGEFSQRRADPLEQDRVLLRKIIEEHELLTEQRDITRINLLNYLKDPLIEPDPRYVEDEKNKIEQLVDRMLILEERIIHLTEKVEPYEAEGRRARFYDDHYGGTRYFKNALFQAPENRRSAIAGLIAAREREERRLQNIEAKRLKEEMRLRELEEKRREEERQEQLRQERQQQQEALDQFLNQYRDRVISKDEYEYLLGRGITVQDLEQRDIYPLLTLEELANDPRAADELWLGRMVAAISHDEQVRREQRQNSQLEQRRERLGQESRRCLDLISSWDEEFRRYILSLTPEKFTDYLGNERRKGVDVESLECMSELRHIAIRNYLVTGDTGENFDLHREDDLLRLSQDEDLFGVIRPRFALINQKVNSLRSRNTREIYEQCLDYYHRLSQGYHVDLFSQIAPNMNPEIAVYNSPLYLIVSARIARQ